jgi:hypothetical protein
MAKRITCSNSKNIFYLLWGKPGEDVFTVSRHDHIIDYEHGKCNGSKLYDMRQLQFEFYKQHPLNKHHVCTSCYIKIVFPFLADLLGFKYNKDDFELKEYIADKMDCSFLWPKQDYKWTVSINQEVTAKHEGFECLINLDGKYPGCKDSAYHKLFCSSHECCKITNDTLTEGKTLFISGDSYMIPVIPFLACYFKEIVFLDNRSQKVSNVPYYEDKVFDYVIIALSEFGGINKFLGLNFY